MSAPRKKPPIFERLPSNNRGASAGYDLVGNIVIGAGLGFVVDRYWPASHPWSLLGGFLLGMVSGFYQLFKQQDRPHHSGPKGKDDERPA